MQALYEKQGRSSQFRTRKERDDWIRKEVKELEGTIIVKEASHAELDAQTQELSSQLMDISQVCLPSFCGVVTNCNQTWGEALALSNSFMMAEANRVYSVKGTQNEALIAALISIRSF